MHNPNLLLIVCEGVTEAEYFNILRKRFRLPTWIKVLPEHEQHRTFGQHEKLIDSAGSKRNLYATELNCNPDDIETWVVCDRDSYKKAFTILKRYADQNSVNLAFSDPQFENYLLQHFSTSKSQSSGHEVITELSTAIGTPYRKSDLPWLDNMIDCNHSIVRTAAINASQFSNHTKCPFFTIHKLVLRLLDLAEEP